MTTIIHTPAELQAINDNLAGDYELGNDIDLAGVTWTPIGEWWYDFDDDTGVWNHIPFTGSFDGKGYTISNLSAFADPDNDDWWRDKGLFGDVMESGSISNVILSNVSITNSSDHSMGALVGSLGDTASITGCSATGTVVNMVSWANDVGGLVGYASSNTIIQNCYVDVSVTSHSVNVGGLGAFIEGTVSNCYSMGDITCNADLTFGTFGTGGLVGSFWGNITNCYSAGLVTVPDWYINDEGICVGGLVGYGSLTSSSCYWDTQTSGMTYSAGGTGKTTAQMQTQSTFTGWNFTTIWGIVNPGYPFLLWTLNVTTVDATGIGQSFATLHGTQSGSNTVCFEYGRTSGNLSKATSEMSATDTFYRRVDGLSPSVVHYFRAVGKVNSGGATYGDILSFMTSAAPYVTPTPASTTGYMWVEGIAVHITDDGTIERAFVGDVV
jgi:hypothetical protein